MNFKTFIKKVNIANRNHLEYKSYQEEGVNWCINREKQISTNTTSEQKYISEIKGGIIADEMGLGKTIVMLGTIIGNPQFPTLIIVPTVLLEQWKDKILEVLGHKCLVYYGAAKKTTSGEDMQKAPITLTTYGTLIQEYSKNKEARLLETNWKRVVFDEAHHLRNKSTKIFKTANKLKKEITWLITGTPIQNKINDMYSLFEILNISNKLYTKISILTELINNIVLKRTKKEVGLNMKPLYTENIKVKWKNKEEKELSNLIHRSINLEDRKMKLALMQFAKMTCVYPDLLLKTNKSQSHLQSQSQSHLQSQSILNTISNQYSKLDKLTDLILERRENGNKKIIFTTYRRESQKIKEILHQKSELKILSNQTRKNLHINIIDGGVSKSKRNKILSCEEKEKTDILILQIKSCNEGLNLQEFNEIYIVSPEWNPKIEEQAIARCHRFGQTKHVMVFHMLMDDLDNSAIDFTSQLGAKNIEQYSNVVQIMKNNKEKKYLCDQ